MPTPRSEPRLPRELLRQAVAIGGLALIVGLAVAGPSGLFAWEENRQLLAQRRDELARLARQRDELKNRVDLLDPRHADRDYAGELVRSRLGVAGSDEMVMLRR